MPAREELEIVEGPSASRRPVPRYGVAVGLGGLLATVLLLGVLTKGTFDPAFRASPEPQALFYDAQARALLDGRLDVPPEAIGGEGITIDGRTYGYFGIMPALLRLPFIGFYSDGYPNLAPWSFLGAFVVETLALLGIWRLVCRHLEVQPPALLAGWLAFALLAGSPHLFLAARPDVYEEAGLWGVAWALVTFGRCCGSTRAVGLIGRALRWWRPFSPCCPGRRWGREPSWLWR